MFTTLNPTCAGNDGDQWIFLSWRFQKVYFSFECFLGSQYTFLSDVRFRNTILLSIAECGSRGEGIASHGMNFIN